MYFGMVFAFLLYFFVFILSFMDFANFKTTKVFNNDCFRTSAFSVIAVKTQFMCAFECSRNVNCRRFMIRKQPNGLECSFYIEGENCAAIPASECSCYMKTYSKLNQTTICPLGLYGSSCENTIKDCDDGYDRGMGGFSRWVRFYINPKIESSTSFEVVCRFHLRGFTLFMSRDRGCNAFSFNRNMAEYVDGFGDADSDYWLGLNRIKEILDNHSQNRLLVVLIENQYCENYYDNFSIASAFDKYALHLGQYESWTAANCGDSFKNSVNIEGSSFSAPGSDQTSFNCAGTHQGGWWYANTTSCSECDLTGSRDFMIWPTTLGGAPQRFVGLFITKNG